MSAETVARELRVMFTANTTDLKRKLENVKSEMKKFPAATDAMQDAYTKSFRAMTAVSDGLKKRMNAVSAELEKTGRISQNSMQGMERDIENAKGAYSELARTLNDLGDKMAKLREMRLYSPEYKNLTEDIKKAETQLKRYEDQQTLMASLGVSETSVQWTRLAEKIKQTKGRIKDLAFDMKQMEDAGAAFTFGGDTAEYADLQAHVRDVILQMNELRETIPGVEGEFEELRQAMEDTANRGTGSLAVGFESMMQGLRGSETLTAQVRSAFESLGAGIGKVGAVVTHPLKSVNLALGKIASTAVSVGKKAASAIGSGLKKAANIGVNALKSLGQRLLGLRSHASNASTGLNNMVRSIRNIGVVSLAMRTAGALFGRFRSVINNCVQSNAAMSAQVERLKNGLSNALAPAISTVINALSKLMPYVVGVADAVASLITNIFGKGWTSVSTSAGAAADAVGGVADATGAAAKAQEEYNRSVMGFDEINKLDAPDNSGSGGGGGGGSSTTSASGEGIKGILPQWLTDLTAEIKELLDNEDFTGIGELLAGKFGDLVLYLNKALKGEEFQRKLKDALSHITDGINGFFDELTFDDEGKVQSIAGMFGDTVGTAIGLGLELIDQALTDIKWDKIGQSLAQFVNGGILALKKQDVNFGTVLADVINAKVSAIGGFFKEIEWSLIGSYAADNVNSAFKTVNWANVGKTFSDGVIGALKSISTFLEEVDWTGMAKDVKEAVANVDWSGIASGIAEGIGAALGGLGAFLWELIKDGIASIGDYFDESIDEAGGNVGLGILNGIANAFSDLKQWVLDNIWEPFKTGFKNAFGIHSPAKNEELLSVAGNVGEGILNGIAAVFTNLKTWVQEHILDKIQGAINTGKELVVNFGAKIADKASDVRNEFQTRWGNLTSKVVSFTSGISSKASDVRDEFQTRWGNLTSKVVSFTSKISSKASDVRNEFQTRWGNLTSKVVSFTSGISSKASDVRDEFQTRWGNLTSKVVSFTSKISSKASDVRNEFQTRWRNLASKVVSFTSKISSKASDVRNEFQTRWGNLTSKVVSFTSGISSKASDVRDEFQTRWSNLKSKSLSFAMTISTKISDLWETFKSGWGAKTLSLSVEWRSVSGSIETAIAKVMGWGSSWPKLKFAARGGIVDAATLFSNGIVAGEAGKEAIVPLENHTEWIGMVARKLMDSMDDVHSPDGESANYLKSIANELRSIQSAAVRSATRQGPSTNRMSGQIVSANRSATLGWQIESSSIVAAAQTDLLQKILAAVESIDPNTYLDGESVTDHIIKIHNRMAEANGRTPLLI